MLSQSGEPEFPGETHFGYAIERFSIDHFTVVAKLPDLRMEARLPVTLLCYILLCFSNGNVYKNLVLSTELIM